MLTLDNLTKALNDFGDKVVEDAKNNLKERKKIASGKLFNSIKNNGAKVTKRSLELSINMPYYGAFVDKGVSGVYKKYDTDFTYRDKKPPPSAFDGWIVKRGLAPRNDKGQFSSREQIKWAISNSIFYYGIKPSLFLTDAVKENINLIPEIVRKSFALDAEEAIKFIIKSNFNQK